MNIQSPAESSLPSKVIEPPAMKRMPSPSSWLCSPTCRPGSATVMNICEGRVSSTGSCHLVKPLGTFDTVSSFFARWATASLEVTTPSAWSNCSFSAANRMRSTPWSKLTWFGSNPRLSIVDIPVPPPSGLVTQRGAGGPADTTRPPSRSPRPRASAVGGGHGREGGIRQLGAAHQKVGQVGVGPVVDERRAVESRRVEAGGAGDGHRGGGVPLVLPAVVHVEVSIPEDDRHRLGPRGAERHQIGAQRVGDLAGLRGRTAAADHHAWRALPRRRGGGGGGRGPPD